MSVLGRAPQVQICGKAKVIWGVGKWPGRDVPLRETLAQCCRRACKTVSGQGQGSWILTPLPSVTGYESLRWGAGRRSRGLTSFQVLPAVCPGRQTGLQLPGSSLPTERCGCRCRCWLLEVKARQMSSV